MKTQLTPSERKILERIREKIEATHWIKGHYHWRVRSGKNAGKDRYCLVGFVNSETLTDKEEHLNLASYDLHIRSAAFRGIPDRKLKQHDRILQRLRDELPYPYGTIQGFNDDSKTRRRDVLALIDKALGRKS